MYLILKASDQNYGHEYEAGNKVESVHAHQHIHERTRRIGVGATEKGITMY
jgi:hypothetical protein